MAKSRKLPFASIGLLPDGDQVLGEMTTVEGGSHDNVLGNMVDRIWVL
eukprot:CAMPEP_0168234618 /NCGR_PEP_ID=MMETSP0140_2-20121125/18364_1 /TAXON_ID=44445 /ORGANISM="Pseudo-nitzschia australis, Strain 10249 10 AB" /LENGTH=47 /DNA_ID= /DNA_START= /DNA_END= /DNA_ORIENTATION=